MRSLLLITLSCIALVGAFYVYTIFESTHVNLTEAGVKTSTAPRQPSHGKSVGGIKGGERPWLVEFDENTGELKRRIRAEEYMPQENGKILVTKPEAWFYMPNHQIMHLTGDTGEIVIPEPDAPGKGSTHQPAPGVRHARPDFQCHD